MTRTPLAALVLSLAFASWACDHDEACHGGCPEDSATLMDTAGVEVSPDATSDSATTDPRSAYCDCNLILCHDEFHALYGVGDEVAVPACNADADTLSDAVIECRRSACSAGDCAAALGDGDCLSD